jgi:hypothetical protein
MILYFHLAGGIMSIESHEADGERIDKDHIILARRAMANFVTAHERRKASRSSEATPANCGVFSKSEDNAGYTLDLSHLLLNDDEFLLLLPEIAKLPALCGLNLESNSITGKSIERMLSELPRIQELSLNRCPRVKRNNGCQHLAQLRYLRTLDVTRNGLVSEDFDKLTTSHSLTCVDWFENEHVDPVRKGRLVAALAFNEGRLLKFGSSNDEDPEQVQKEKTEFIRLNIDKFVRIALQKEKADRDFRVSMCRRHPLPGYMKGLP